MVEPKCKYFGKCGGCSSQHIDYNIQLVNKRKLVENALNFKEIEVFSDKPFNYRNRMDLIFHSNGLGFRQKGKWWKIVDIDKCVISNDKLNNLLEEIRDYFKGIDAFDLKKQIGTYKYAVIRTPSEISSISFVLNSDSSKLKEAVEKIKEYSKISSADNIIVTYVPKKSDISMSNEYFVVKGDEFLFEMLMKKKFYYHVQGFFQNNSKMADKMLQYTNQLLSSYDVKDSFLLDLYGGVGTFGIINSNLFKKVLIVESLKQSIDCANKNIKENNIQNAKTLVLGAKKLSKIDILKDSFVITDPPRSGMHPKTISQINKIEPKSIIYVSCNIKQLSKDIHKFIKYKLKSVAMFDLFPQTPHIETIVELIKDK